MINFLEMLRMYSFYTIKIKYFGLKYYVMSDTHYHGLRQNLFVINYIIILVYIIIYYYALLCTEVNHDPVCDFELLNRTSISIRFLVQFEIATALLGELAVRARYVIYCQTSDIIPYPTYVI